MSDGSFISGDLHQHFRILLHQLLHLQAWTALCHRTLNLVEILQP